MTNHFLDRSPVPRLALVFVFLITLTPARSQQVGSYVSGFERSGNMLTMNFTEAQVKIEVCTPEVIRVRHSWGGTFRANEPYMVVKYDWEEVDFTTEETGDFLEIKTPSLIARVFKSPFAITFLDTDGNILSAGKGSKANGKEVANSRELGADEHFFGFGERMDFLDRRGKETKLNVGRGIGKPHIIGAYDPLQANYSPVPFFMSTAGYGLFFHNSAATTWDMGSANSEEYTISAAGGELDYYFISGPKFAQILNRYTDITGKSPMMNRFAFGLHVGTYSGGTWGHDDETSTEYVVALARKFRALGIPLDILHLDSTWRIFGEEGGKGATTFEWRPTFKDPESMFDSLYDLNLNMVGVHLRPRFDNGNKLRLLDQARELGHVYPENDQPGEFVNFFDQQSVDWWWDNGVMRVAEQGAMFLKTDEGSAFGRKANESNKVGPQGEGITELHNVFPIVYAKAPYEKFQTYNNLRGMNHTREGYAGIQRYPFIFAGDWPSEWQYFEPLIKAGLNIGLSGVGYWAHCMGGFEHVADPELYKRWVAFGLMSPVAHLFGMDHPAYKEPWNYGEEGLEIFRFYDQMRYRLIPYSYANAWEMYNNGLPLMRALVLEYQDDYNTYSIDDQYLLGSSILIAPVTTKGSKTRQLYLPEGKWYNHWNGKVYEGKRYYNIVAPIEQLPMFYKAGAIIPTQPDVQYIGKELPEEMTVEVYAGADGGFTLYEDDGRSLDYQEGAYATTEMTYTEGDEAIGFVIGKSEGNFKIPKRRYSVNIHGVAGLDVGKLGKFIPFDFSYDEASQVLTVKFEKKANEVISFRVSR